MKLCKCGCGGKVKLQYHHRYYGEPEYLRGHNPSYNKGKELHYQVWNKGLHYKNDKLSETRKRLFKLGTLLHPNKGKHLSLESRKKMSLRKKENPINYWLGKNRSEDTKVKLRKYCGEKSSRWQGGKSYESYTIEFNNELRESIRKRDQYRCQECFRCQDELYSYKGKKQRLDIHHIDFDKKNNNYNNLISLCRSCHAQTQFGRENWMNYYKQKQTLNNG